MSRNVKGLPKRPRLLCPPFQSRPGRSVPARTVHTLRGRLGRRAVRRGAGCLWLGEVRPTAMWGCVGPKPFARRRRRLGTTLPARIRCAAMPIERRRALQGDRPAATLANRASRNRMLDRFGYRPIYPRAPGKKRIVVANSRRATPTSAARRFTRELSLLKPTSATPTQPKCSKPMRPKAVCP